MNTPQMLRMRHLSRGGASKKGQRRVSRRTGVTSVLQDESVLPGVGEGARG